MILLFPTLIEGINTPEGKEAFKASCHMFYGRRVVDIRDGLPKWEGLDDKSRRLDEDGNVEAEGEEREHGNKRQKVEGRNEHAN